MTFEESALMIAMSARLLELVNERDALQNAQSRLTGAGIIALREVTAERDALKAEAEVLKKEAAGAAYDIAVLRHNVRQGEERYDYLKAEVERLRAEAESDCEDDEPEGDEDDREQLRAEMIALSQQYPALYEGIVSFSCFGLLKPEDKPLPFPGLDALRRKAAGK